MCEEKEMRKIRIISILTIMILVLGASTSSLAKTEYFGGTMYYRVLNGADNNVFYSFEADKNIMSV